MYTAQLKAYDNCIHLYTHTSNAYLPQQDKDHHDAKRNLDSIKEQRKVVWNTP